MLMPSATMGCASAAALPTAKMPSRPNVRTPVRSGPEDSQTAVTFRRRQRQRDTRARRFDMKEDGLTGADAGPLSPAAIELVAANAARQADATTVGVHQPAIAPRKGEQRHQVRGQRAAE